MIAELLITFVIASALLAIAPGPDNFFVLSQSILFGQRSGILITLGLCTGLVFHTCIVAFGVASLMQTTQWGFMVLKIFGAAYLLYLAWQINKSALLQPAGEGVTLSDKALYVRGIVMNISNPKVSLFFLAFLPQFTDPQAGSVATQIVLLGVIFGVISLLIFSTIAIAAAQIGIVFARYPNLQQALKLITTLLFVLLALNLLFSVVHSVQ